jgi:hypothetical protein
VQASASTVYTRLSNVAQSMRDMPLSFVGIELRGSAGSRRGLSAHNAALASALAVELPVTATASGAVRSGLSAAPTTAGLALVCSHAGTLSAAAAGITCDRRLWCGANTLQKRIRGCRGGGISAASEARPPNGARQKVAKRTLCNVSRVRLRRGNALDFLSAARTSSVNVFTTRRAPGLTRQRQLRAPRPITSRSARAPKATPRRCSPPRTPAGDVSPCYRSGGHTCEHRA